MRPPAAGDPCYGIDLTLEALSSISFTVLP